MPCILPNDLRKLRAGIMESGGISNLRKMTAEERVNFFAPYVDLPGKTSSAEWLNRQFEQKLLKPAQIKATKEWLKRLEKKGVKGTNKKMLVDRIINRSEVMNPRSGRMFAEGIAKQLMGFSISQEDAKTMFDLASTINEQKKALLRVKPDYYGLTADEVRKLDGDALKARQALAESMVKFQKIYEANNLKAQQMAYDRAGWWQKRWEDILKVAGNIKSLKASVDFSFLRQIQNTAYVDFKSFKDAWSKGFKAWFESETGVETMLGDLLTRPNALNGNYNMFGIEVGIKEEAFPESWLSKQIDKKAPRLNLLRRSEESFNIAIQNARANIFDWMLDQTRSENNPQGDLKLLKAQGIGKAINIITGRGKLTKDENINRAVNNLLFAPRWLMSRVNTLLDLRFIGKIAQKSPYGIRARAALGNAIVIGALAPALQYMFDRDDDESFYDWLGRIFDPRSSDFGKVKIGRTRFDLTTGTAGLITLAARLTTGQTRTTTTGKVKKMPWTITIGNFLRGKSAPGARLITSTLIPLITEGKTKGFFGDTQKWDTPGEIAANIGDLLAPISVQTGYEVVRDIQLHGIDQDTWGMVFGWLGDIFGVAANTYDRK